MIIHGALMAASLIFMLTQSQLHSADTNLVIYEPEQTGSPWKAIETEGLKMKQSAQGLELEFPPFEKGKNEWPRVVFAAEGVDLSEYSQIIFEMEALDDSKHSLLLAARSDEQNITSPAAVAAEVGNGPAQKVVLDISDGSPVDQSRVREIYICLPRPPERARYLLRGIKAVKNPDYLNRRKALGNLLAETQSAVEAARKAIVPGNENVKEIDEAERLLSSAKSDWDKRNAGYATLVDKKVDKIQQVLGKHSMRTREGTLAVWTSPLGFPIRQGTLPGPGDENVQKIERRLLSGQYLSVPINFSAGVDAQELEVKLVAPQSSGQALSLRPAHWVKSRDSSMTADAIGEPMASVKLDVSPFHTEQVLLWIDAKHQTLPKGLIEAKIEIFQKDKLISSIPLSFDVLDLKLPEKLPLLFMNWAYFYTDNVGETKGIEREARDNLRDYGINTWVINYRQVPIPKIGPDGAYAGMEEGSVKAFREVMELLKGQPDEHFIVWLGFHNPEVVAKFEKPGVLEKYLVDLHALLEEYGVPKNRRYLSFWDEPDSHSTRETVKWMEKIRSIDPSFLFFDNSSHPPEDPNEYQKYLALTDVWMPNWEAFLEKRRGGDSKEWESVQSGPGFYRCLMGRNNRGVNIYEYYRLLGWYAMKQKAGVLGFWVYNVGTTSEWDGTLGTSGGQVAYSKDGKLLSSRRWELIREAIDDYRLGMLALGTNEKVTLEGNANMLDLSKKMEAETNDPKVAEKVREQLIDLALERKEK